MGVLRPLGLRRVAGRGPHGGARPARRPQGRFERTGETDVGDEKVPAVVGVRLRRVIVVAPSRSATGPDQGAARRS
jgi:hypothetical protein